MNLISNDNVWFTLPKLSINNNNNKRYGIALSKRIKLRKYKGAIICLLFFYSERLNILVFVIILQHTQNPKNSINRGAR